jgi:hypothetical protein
MHKLRYLRIWNFSKSRRSLLNIVNFIEFSLKNKNAVLEQLKVFSESKSDDVYISRIR